MRSHLFVVALLAVAATAVAAETPPPSGVLSLTAQASIEVPKDVMAVAFGASREGPDANSVQSGLKQALDAALAEARKVARPGQLEVQTGNFSLHPRYSNKGQMIGWQGSAELLVEGKDMSGISLLTGRITTMTIARVGYGLSREARDKIDSDMTAQAIARFRAKALEHTKHFGYSGYTVREVSVSSSEPPMPHAAPMLRAQAMAAADEALPVQPGKAQVTVSVNGSVQMTK